MINYFSTTVNKEKIIFFDHALCKFDDNAKKQVN